MAKMWLCISARLLRTDPHVFPSLPPPLCSDLLVRLVSVDLHTFGPDALTAVRLIEHQANADQAAEVQPQLVEQVPAAVQGPAAPGECLYISSICQSHTVSDTAEGSWVEPVPVD